jgi:UDP-N-acetylglucosamine:LPS N-acetylglucosamine transferase
MSVRAAEHRPGSAGELRRVLVVSADIGGGHHATGRALEAAVRARWPAAEVEWTDTLEVMRAGPAFRAIYRANVQWTPWLYDFFYGQIERHRWFARSAKWVTSVWAGVRLAPVLERIAPDLILSTYPLGSGGLAWLRRRGRLDVPVGAWISDFAPHPFWVHDALDLHVVMHAACVPLALRAEPAARVVPPAALPVPAVFAPGDAASARAALGLRDAPLTVLVSCGVYGFGAVEQAVDVLLVNGDGRVQVVAVCGRNSGLQRRLERRPEAGERLVVLGWTDAMPQLTRAADVVVTNAGGVTALEALASGRPVVMFRPIAGHGRANAAAMAAAGVAVVCRTGGELAEEVRRLLDEPAHRRRLQRAALATATGGTPAEDVERLLTVPRHRPAVPLSSTDALFALVDSARVPQHVAALALLRPRGAPVTARDIRDAMTATVPVRPWLTWWLDVNAGRRPCWRSGGGGGDGRGGPVELPVGPARYVEGGAAERFERFVSRPLPAGAPPWEVQVDEGWPDGRTAMLIRAHHAFGDGLAILDAFTGILTRSPSPDPIAALAAPVARGAREARAREPRPGAAQAFRLVRGLVSLARAGAAPPTALHARRSGGRPSRHAFLVLPLVRVRAARSAAGVGTSTLLVGLVAEALHRFLTGRGTPSPSNTVRAMIPRTRRVGVPVDGPGNRTAALRVDLPVGPMPTGERMRRTGGVLAAALRQDQPIATAAVVAAAARLPVRLHRTVARWLYRSTWLDLMVSVIPGPPTPRWFGSACMEEAYAVLPLAEGVGLALGIMSWSSVVTVALTWDPVLLPDGQRLVALLEQSLDAFGELP